ncbi:MAG: T9SS type A sorting domain-containing protein, partial [Flavobacteriaceae bacterium]|nr:T9SS type A sorting domain-containing protein [Flavobacteriaceae bacterium]
DDNGVNSGQVRIYKFIPGKVDRWVQTGSDIDGEASEGQSGWSVSLSSDGRFAAIGAPYNDNNGVNSGQVRILNVRSVLGVSEEFVMQNFSVFPNPSNSIFTISLGNDLALKEVSLIDCSGRQVLKSTKLKIDISSISQGIYYLKVVTNKGIGIKKVIVE